MFKFEIDGTEVENPIGWNEINVKVTREPLVNNTFLTFEGELIFTGLGYNLIKDKFDTDGFCNLMELVVYYIPCNSQSWKIFSKFNIFISDVEFNIFTCQAKTPIVDANWGTYIQNNKQIKTKLSLPTTKNGLPINVPSVDTFQKFKPSDGTYIGAAQGVSIYEMFRYFIEWMSDNKVKFVSDYFSTGAGKDFSICTGFSLRTGNFTPIFTSFWYAYSEVNKKLRIGVSYYTENGTNYVRIENYNYFLTNNSVVTLDNVKDILLRTNNKEMYASLRAGSTEYFEIGQCDNGNTECTFGQIPFLTWADDALGTAGTCNIETIADLTTNNEFLIDSNIIEDIVVYGNSNYDRNIFIISIDRASMMAIKTDFFGIGKYWYNDSIANYNVYFNWFQGLPNFSNNWIAQNNLVDIYAGVEYQEYFCDTPPSCLAVINCSDDLAVRFDNENLPYYDINGNNDGGLFVAPYSGNYEIQFELTYEGLEFLNPATQGAAEFWDTTLGTFTSPAVFAVMPQGNQTVTSNLATVFLTQGHKYVVLIRLWNGCLKFTGGWLRIKSILNLPIPTIPSSDFMAKEYQFEKFVTLDQLEQVIANPSSLIEFNGGGLNHYEKAWMRDVNINIQNLQGNFVLGSL